MILKRKSPFFSWVVSKYSLSLSTTLLPTAPFKLFSRLNVCACGVKTDHTRWGWSRSCRRSRRAVRWLIGVWMRCFVTRLRRGRRSPSQWGRTEAWTEGLWGPYKPLCCQSDGVSFVFMFLIKEYDTNIYVLSFLFELFGQLLGQFDVSHSHLPLQNRCLPASPYALDDGVNFTTLKQNLLIAGVCYLLFCLLSIMPAGTFRDKACTKM